MVNYKGLLRVKGSKEVIRGYRGLQGVIRGYKGLQVVRGGYKRLQGVTRQWLLTLSPCKELSVTHLIIFLF